MSRFSSLSYSAAATAFVLVLVLVLVLVPYKILIHEDEYEKNQIRSHASALRPQPSTLYHVARMKLQSFFFDQTGRVGDQRRH
jgi:hypothetical protein